MKGVWSRLSEVDAFSNPNAQAPACGLNQLLNQLGSEGAHHSEGQFSLSLEKALEKLKQFQLRDPNFYILNLVSAAVLQGASSFRVLLSRTEDTIEFDGKRFTRAQLEKIFVSEEPALKELAVGLTAVKGLDYERVVFASEGGLVWEDTTPQFQDSGNGLNRITLVKKSIKRIFGDSETWPKVWSSLSERALKQSCQLAPLIVKLNHRQVNKNMLQVEAPAFKVEHEDFQLPTLKKYGRKENEIVALPSNGRYSAFVCGNLDKVMTEASRASRRAQDWYFIFRGITYTRTSEQLKMAGLGGIVISDGFTKDISHSDIVENEFFRDVVQQIQDMLVVYVKEHLTRKSQQRDEARAWFAATTLAGELLGKAGEAREAARVDAWTYGHRAKMRLLTVDDCQSLTTRYDQPLAFLLDFFYWNSLLSVEDQLRLLSGSSDSRAADKTLLLPWIKDAQPESLVKLFHFFLTALPDEVCWNTISPLWKALEMALTPEDFRGKLLLPLAEKILSVIGGVDHPINLCQAVSVLHRHGVLPFDDWLKNALESGLLPANPGVRNWLLNSIHKAEAKELLQRLDSDERSDRLSQADGAFRRMVSYLETPAKTVRGHLEDALELTEDGAERADMVALLCLLGVHPAEVSTPTLGAWRSHRAGLVLASQGRFGEARDFHESAHRSLQEHWTSHLLLGDIALAVGEPERAHNHYGDSLERRAFPATQEAVIETSDLEIQQEQWLNLARSLSVNKLESYFAYREALELPVSKNLATWVSLRALTSLADHSAGGIPVFEPQSALLLALRSPSVVRAHVRSLRRNGDPVRAAKCLARLRLAQQLSQSAPLRLRWKEEFHD